MTLENRCSGPSDSRPVVAILMCTYNGASFLHQQMRSIIDQTYTNWFLAISDDGSTDATLAIIDGYRSQLGARLRVYSGPRQGFAQNFMSLASNSDLQADYFAFADQDDIWHLDKLHRSVSALAGLADKNRPTVYCGRCRLVDEQGLYLGLSPLFKRKPSFENALVQSLAGANTMLLNAQARQLLMSLPPKTPVVAHDWLTYLLTTAYGGLVIYDATPTVDYRQHVRNVIGANTNILARCKRVGMLLRGRFQSWSRANLQVLDQLRPPLSERNAQTLRLFKQSHGAGGVRSLIALYRSGVYRQTSLGQCSLLVAAFLGKI